MLVQHRSKFSGQFKSGAPTRGAADRDNAFAKQLRIGSARAVSRNDPDQAVGVGERGHESSEQASFAGAVRAHYNRQTRLFTDRRIEPLAYVVEDTHLRFEFHEDTRIRIARKRIVVETDGLVD